MTGQIYKVEKTYRVVKIDYDGAVKFSVVRQLRGSFETETHACEAIMEFGQQDITYTVIVCMVRRLVV